jgi:hypothetical protein
MALSSAPSKRSEADHVARRREPAVHELKCWPPFFGAIKAGHKTHDLRRADDRDFQIGDQLLLREYDPQAQTYTGRTLTVKVTYITSAEIPCALSRDALHPGFAILSINLIS